MVVRLEPIRHDGVGVPREVLFDGVTERPSIRLDLNQVVVLGTNSTTLIAAQGLAENTVSLLLEEVPTTLLTTHTTTRIRIVNVGSEGHISVNGKLINSRKTVFLQPGDELSLHAPDRAYDYRVIVRATDDDDVVPPVAAVVKGPADSDSVSISSRNLAPFTSAVATAAVPPPNWSQIAEEFVCAVCLDLQVQSTTLVPCGHSFCKACLSTGDDRNHAFFKPTVPKTPRVCSLCTATVSTTVPCRTLDNVIASLVATNQVFPPDDVQVYLERMKKVTEAPTRAQNKRKKHSPGKQRRRRGSGGGSSTATTDTSVISHQNRHSVVARAEIALTGATVFDAICID